MPVRAVGQVRHSQTNHNRRLYELEGANVVNYGVDITGVNDSYNAMIKAIAASLPLFIPAGKVKFSQRLTFPSHTVMIGKGGGAFFPQTEFIYTGNSIGFFVDGNASAGDGRVDMLFQGFSIRASVTCSALMQVEYSFDYEFRDVGFDGKSLANYGLILTNCHHGIITRGHFDNCLIDGSVHEVKNNATDNIFTGQTVYQSCRWTSCVEGLAVRRPFNTMAQLYFENAHFLRCSIGASIDAVGGVTFINPQIEGQTGVGIITAESSDNADPVIINPFMNAATTVDGIHLRGMSGQIIGGKGINYPTGGRYIVAKGQGHYIGGFHARAGTGDSPIALELEASASDCHYDDLMLRRGSTGAWASAVVNRGDATRHGRIINSLVTGVVLSDLGSRSVFDDGRGLKYAGTTATVSASDLEVNNQARVTRMIFGTSATVSTFSSIEAGMNFFLTPLQGRGNLVLKETNPPTGAGQFWNRGGGNITLNDANRDIIQLAVQNDGTRNVVVPMA